MIRFELNNPAQFALTNDQLNAVTDHITEHGWHLDYDIVEGDTAGIIWLWVHPIDGYNPTRHWIEPDGITSLSEEVTWDWKGIQHDN